MYYDYLFLTMHVKYHLTTSVLLSLRDSSFYFSPMYLFSFNATRMLGLIERNSSGHIVAAGIMHADWFMQSSAQVRGLYSKHVL